MKTYFEVKDEMLIKYIPFNSVVKMWQNDGRFFIVVKKGENERVSKDEADLFLQWLQLSL